MNYPRFIVAFRVNKKKIATYVRKHKWRLEYIPKMESTNLLHAKVIFYLAIRGRSLFSYLLPSRRG